MTTTTLTASPALTAQPSSTRIWRIVRLHLVNKGVYIGVPWMIIGSALAVSLIVALLIRFAAGDAAPKALEGMTYSWAVISPLWYLVVVAVQSISSSFPFALGFGVTRRDFYLGTSLLFVMISAGNAIALALLTEIEKATSGWFIGAHMFDALWFSSEPFISNLFTFFVAQLGICFIGACVATIYMRWRVTGMLVFWLSFAALLIVSAAVLVLTGAWTSVGAWLFSLSAAGVFGVLLVPVVLAAFFGFFILRGATPKN